MRSRSKNEIHAVLMRRLKGKPPVSDLFGVEGREWLGGLELPVEQSETLEAGMRHIELLDAEIAAVERLIGSDALRSLRDSAADDGARREPDLCGLVHRRDR